MSAANVKTSPDSKTLKFSLTGNLAFAYLLVGFFVYSFFSFLSFSLLNAGPLWGSILNYSFYFFNLDLLPVRGMLLSYPFVIAGLSHYFPGIGSFVGRSNFLPIFLMLVYFLYFLVSAFLGPIGFLRVYSAYNGSVRGKKASLGIIGFFLFVRLAELR